MDFLLYYWPAWTRSSYSCETYRINDSNVRGSCSNALEELCNRGRCGHGNSGIIGILYIHSEVWSAEGLAKGKTDKIIRKLQFSPPIMPE